MCPCVRGYIRVVAVWCALEPSLVIISWSQYSFFIVFLVRIIHHGREVMICVVVIIPRAGGGNSCPAGIVVTFNRDALTHAHH